MPIGSSDVEINVDANFTKAESSLNKFIKEFTEGFKEGAAEEVNKWETAAKKGGKAADDLGKAVKGAGTAAKTSDGSIRSFGDGIIKLNQGLELAGKGLRAFEGIFTRISGAIQGGAAFADLSATFDDLSKKAGSSGKDLFNGLNEALDGTVSKADITKQAVEGLFAGLKPDQLILAADAARKFGDQLGGSSVEKLNVFTQALVRGSDAQLKKIGITVDNVGAQRKWIESLGVTGKKVEDLRSSMTEEQKIEAQRIGITDALTKKTEGMGKVSLDAGDKVDTLTKRWADFKTDAELAVSQNESLNKVLDHLLTIVAGADFAPLINGLTTIIGLFVKAGEAGGNFFTDVIAKFDSSLAHATPLGKHIESQLQGVTDQIGSGQLGDLEAAKTKIKEVQQEILGITDATQKASISTFGPDIDKLVTQIKDAEKALKGVNKEQDKTTTSTQKGTAAVKNETAEEKKLSQEYATKKAKLKALQDQYNTTGQGAKDAAAESKKLSEEFKAFDKQLESIMGVDHFPALTQQINELFATSQNDLQLDTQLEAAAAAAQKLKIPLDEVLSRIQKAKENRPELGPGNDAGQGQAIDNGAGPAAKQGGFFGFDLGTGLGTEFESGLSSVLQTSVQAALNSIGGTKFDTSALVSSLSTSIGAGIGLYFSGGSPEGAQIGGTIGSFVGEIVNIGIESGLFGKESAGTTARKSADKFFADMFDANRLSIIVGDQVKQVHDLVFSGDTQFGGNVEAGGAGFGDFFDTLPDKARGAISGVADAFTQILGIGEDIGNQLAVVFANNLGGSLLNLQVLVEQTGKSFEDLGNALYEAFAAGDISLQQFIADMHGLVDAASDGTGDIKQDFLDMTTALNSGHPGLALIQSIKNIAADAERLHLQTLPQLYNYLTSVLGLDAQKVAEFMKAAEAIGIDSVKGIADASNIVLAQVGQNITDLQNGIAPTQTAPIIIPGSDTGRTDSTLFGGATYPAADKGGGASKDSKKDNGADKAAAALKALNSEIFKSFTGSKAYSSILDELTSKTIKQSVAQKELKELYATTAKNVKDFHQVEKDLQAELEKGSKASAEKIATLSQKYEKLQATLKEDKGSKAISINFGTLINQMNVLGAVASFLGQTFDNVSKNIVNAFKVGTLSAKQARDELNDSQEALTGGLGKGGTLSQAFTNLQSHGTKGGVLSIRDIRDIAAESEKQFKTNLSPARQKQFNELTDRFNTTHEALQTALASGPFTSDTKLLQDQAEGAKNALDDFNATLPKVNLQDLRTQLEASFDPATVAKFFQAMSTEGIDTFDELKGASDDTVTKLLGDLEDFSFPFKATETAVTNVLDQLNKLTQPDHHVSVVFDITSNPLDKTSQSIITTLYGADGAGGLLGQSTSTTLSGTGQSTESVTPGGLTPKQLTRYNYLKRLKAKGIKLDAKQQADFKKFSALAGG